MNPWIIILVVLAGIVFGLDYLVRRKKWQDNTKAEKASLLINMFSVGVYLFLSFLGLLWGIAAGSPQTPLGEAVYDVTIVLAGAFFVVAIAAVVLSFILRKVGKVKASIWTNIIAFLYIALVFAVNIIAGEWL